MHHTWKAYASKTQFLSGKSGSLKNERRWMTVNLLKLVTELLKNPCQQSYRSQDVRTTGKWQGLDSFNHEDLSNSSNWANSVLFQAGRLKHCTHHTLHSCFCFYALRRVLSQNITLTDSRLILQGESDFGWFGKNQEWHVFLRWPWKLVKMTLKTSPISMLYYSIKHCIGFHHVRF